jgi:glyoxylase-like metal-dependent hydrolase (beta-lactamase superfamily II)
MDQLMKTRLEPTLVAPETFLIHDHQGEGTAPVSVALNTLVIRAAEPVVVDPGVAENREQYLADVFGLVEPEDVRWVYLSHDDVDHTGNVNALMDACPNATLLAHPRAAKHVVDPAKLIKSAEAVYGEAAFRELYGDIRPVPEARVRAMADGETTRFGERTLTFLHPRGHADHHACVLDSGSSGIFTGDSFGLVYPALQENGLFAIPSTSPTDFDAPAARASLARIVASGASRAFLTHFGEQRDLTAIAAQLDAQLEAYGAIAEEAFASGLESEALERFCAERVQAIFERLLRERAPSGDARTVLKLDADLNAQGVAFAVAKRRYKAARSA